MDIQERQKVLQILNSDEVVEAVFDSKSELVGPGVYRFKAEIDFNGEVIVRRQLDSSGHKMVEKLSAAALKQKDVSDKEMISLLRAYGEDVATAMGSEVDRLENKIKQEVPSIKHVDIETA